MGAIEPGEVFEVGYGNGHSVKVKSLSLREEREALKLLSAIRSSDGNIDVVFDAIEGLMRLFCVDYSDTFIDDRRLNRALAMEIAGKAMKQSSLSEEEQKKLESPPSSGAA